jgi:hypothetical protein
MKDISSISFKKDEIKLLKPGFQSSLENPIEESRVPIVKIYIVTYRICWHILEL